MMRIFDQKQLGKHFQTNQLSYLFILILFLMGLIFGAIIVVTMHFTQKQDIIFYLNRYFEQMHEPLRFINHELFKSALYSHLQYLIIFFLLGLSIIGLPIIWSIVFVKGTFIGFSVGFFVYQYGFRGLLFICSALLPQNILIIPVYIFRFINHELFKSALYSHLQYLIIFFLLGLSIIGLPIIWSIVFVKGTFIGFSVGFFVYQYGFRGLLFISSALLPQNILIIPVYIFAGTIAMIFSGELLKKLSGRRLSRFTLEPVIQYAILFIGLTLIVVIAALIEGYLTSSILQYTIELIN